MHILYWFNSEGAIMKESETDKNLMFSEASPALLEPQQGLFTKLYKSRNYKLCQNKAINSGYFMA